MKVWQLAENKIMYTNSFKKKISVIFGVSQMLLGVLLSIWNHVFVSLAVFCCLEYAICLQFFVDDAVGSSFLALIEIGENRHRVYSRKTLWYCVKEDIKIKILRWRAIFCQWDTKSKGNMQQACNTSYLNNGHIGNCVNR